MIVQCDKCSQSYRVNADKLPSQGGRIKCPQCENIFFVKSPHALPELERPQSDKIEVNLKEEEHSTWKLRLAGLSYAFQGLDNLHDWLLARNSLDGVKIAKDDDDWKELGDYEGVMTPELITKFFPLGDVPTSQALEAGAVPVNEPVNHEKVLTSDIPSTQMSVITAKRPTRSKAAQKAETQISQGVSPVLKVIVILLLMGAISVMILHFSNVIDISQFLPNNEKEFHVQTPIPVNEASGTGNEPENEPEKILPNNMVEEPQTPTVVQISPEELAAIEMEAYESHLEMAKSLVSKRQWPEARTVLENMLTQHPDDRQVNEMALRVYRALNLSQEAETIRAKLNTLKK